MSVHKSPKYQIPALIEALKQHGLEHDAPSQLSDAFRTGYVAALAAAPAQPAPLDAVVNMLEKKAADYAEEFGHEDMGSLSFGSGSHADAKMEHYTGLLELVDEIRSMPAQPDTHAQELTAYEITVGNLRAEIAALRCAGTGLSNCAFNIAQWAGKTLTPDVCASLDKCRREWDDATHALRTGGKP